MERPRRNGCGEAAIAELARRQQGLLRRSDLHEFGLGNEAISYRAGTSHRLFELLPGVYALGSGPFTRPTLWLAAQFWCEAGGDRAGRGPRASVALSHVSAGACLGHGAEPDLRTIHLTTTGCVRSRRGVTVHRVATLDSRDVRRRGLLRVTSPARTIVDEAGMLAFPELRARADRLKHLPLTDLERLLERDPGRRGARAARRLLVAEQRHTKSEFERRFVAFCRRHGIPPPPEQNTWVAGHKADCVYRTAWLVVELDGRAHHERRAQFTADRQRDTDYQLAHFRIVRLTWWDLEPEWAQRTAATLRAFLAASVAP